MQPLPSTLALAGKVLVVIGGTSGLGLSAARAFVQAGARLVVVGLDRESVAATATELGSDAHVFEADASQPDAAGKSIQDARTRYGGFDGLFHVAGGSGRRWGDGPLHELTNEGWRATLDLNLSSVMYSNRAAVRAFLEQRKGGTILNTGSVLASSPSPHFFSTHAYAAAKSALAGLTLSCAAYYAPQNIRFNVLAPGLIATPMSRRAQADPCISAFIHTKQPLDGGRIGQPQDIAAAAVFFMSDASRFVTGQVLNVDGGWSLTEGQFLAREADAE